MRSSNELRVGIVVVASLIFATIGYFFLRGLGFGADLYYVRLNHPIIIANGNDVRLQGVRIGEVQDVRLDPETQKPLLTIAVRRQKPPFKLLQSYKYSVRASGVLGDNYVDISGNYDPASATFAPNDKSQIIVADANNPLMAVGDQASELIKDFRVTLKKFNLTVDKINDGVLSSSNQLRLAHALESVTVATAKIGQSFGSEGFKVRMGDPQAQHALTSTLASASVAAREASNAARNIRFITQDAGGVLNENRGQLRHVIAGLDHTANNVAGITDTLNFVMKQGGFKENAQIAFRALRRASENLEATTAGFKSVSNEESQKNLRSAIVALRETTEAARASAQSVRSLVADQAVQTQLKATLGSLQETTASLRDTAQSVKGLATDPAVQGEIRGTLAKLNATATNLNITMENLRDSSAGLKNVVTDPKVQADIKGSVAELRSTLAASRSAFEGVSRVLGGRHRATPPGPAGKANQPSSDANLDQGLSFALRRYSDIRGPRVGSDVTGRTYGDIRFDANLLGGPFRLGLDNLGEGTGLTIQPGKKLSAGLDLRYGLYRSRLGLGLGWQHGPLSVEGNYWDPNRHSTNVYLGVKVAPRIEVLAGRENIRGVRANVLGVRLRP